MINSVIKKAMPVIGWTAGLCFVGVCVLVMCASPNPGRKDREYENKVRPSAEGVEGTERSALWLSRQPCKPWMSAGVWSSSSCRARPGFGRSVDGGAGAVKSGSVRSSVSSASTCVFVLS